LKWICGFANAQGGHIDIGRTDDGEIVGISDAKRLLEELPNKIRNTMGIVANINLLNENGLDYISIDVPAHPNAISYREKYYLRSGSTNQELSGFALDDLLLRKYGRTWDSAPILHVTSDDLDIVAFREFRKKSLARSRLFSHRRRPCLSGRNPRLAYHDAGQGYRHALHEVFQGHHQL
jgi:ATP-dependent DNA helicase RecG